MWNLTIVNATAGTCACVLACGCPELYVQVNDDDSNESVFIDDDIDDDDIVDPVWNFDAGDFTYNDLGYIAIKIYDYDSLGDDELLSDDLLNFQSPWLGLLPVEIPRRSPLFCLRATRARPVGRQHLIRN